MLHQLRYAAVDGSKRWLLVACGASLPSEPSGLPLTQATAWGSEVECEDCRERPVKWMTERELKEWRKDPAAAHAAATKSD